MMILYSLLAIISTGFSGHQNPAARDAKVGQQSCSSTVAAVMRKFQMPAASRLRVQGARISTGKVANVILANAVPP